MTNTWYKKDGSEHTSCVEYESDWALGADCGILDMVEAMRKRDLAVTIGTNDLLLNPKVCNELVRLGVDRVIISIDGGKPETYAEVRGAMLAQVIEHIQGLNEVKRQLHSLLPAIGIEFVALRSNIAELDDLVMIAARSHASLSYQEKFTV